MKRIKWTFEKLQEEAIKYSNRSDFQKFSCGAYSAALRRKLLDNVCVHMGDSIKKPWSYDELKNKALTYKKRIDFARGDWGAYQAASSRNILDIICSHMGDSKTKPYTLEELKQEAIKYRTRGEFQKKSCSAYVVANRRGILDLICSHMKSSAGTSIMERDLFDIVKNSYPSVRKLRITKIDVVDMPYIKGFELDIFIPELQVGIEFDGDYYHSFKYMRGCKQKSSWPDHAITNYHEIKDDYFLKYKNIKVLHIKENEWINNKKECVDRCLQFLSMKQKEVI